MKSLPYSEGSVFLVPLRTGGYARGVVARAGPDGRGLFGYFFGPRLASSEAAVWNDLDPSAAVLRVKFGDLGLINGEWLIRGIVRDFNRTEWPMPDFVRRAPGMKARLVRYSDSDPMHIDAEYPIDDDAMLPTDSLSGYGAVEIKLTKLLG
jgi:hypothetical protein